MKSWIRRRGIARMERELGVELPHLREMERLAPGMLTTLGMAQPAVGYRRRAPTDLINLARIAATRVQDCGDCLQIAVNVALREGVPRAVVEAAVTGRAHDLTDAQRAAMGFGEKVASGMAAEEERGALLDDVGEVVVLELALAVATAQLFPVLRRAMGMSHACRLDLVRYPT